jgi:hypothetical protein
MDHNGIDLDYEFTDSIKLIIIIIKKVKKMTIY